MGLEVGEGSAGEPDNPLLLIYGSLGMAVSGAIPNRFDRRRIASKPANASSIVERRNAEPLDVPRDTGFDPSSRGGGSHDRSGLRGRSQRTTKALLDLTRSSSANDWPPAGNRSPIESIYRWNNEINKTAKPG
jgi:hypothetical protein